VDGWQAAKAAAARIETAAVNSHPCLRLLALMKFSSKKIVLRGQAFASVRAPGRTIIRYRVFGQDYS
jgi:hypothetical protein